MNKKLLHVGCGALTKHQLKGFSDDTWIETRFDIDPSVNPDVVGTLTDMNAVATKEYDAIYSSHNIEHVFPHEVPIVLNEFKRVLKDDGFVVITCPDLQSVCEAIVQDRLVEPLYTSPAGPITPLDILYGYRPSMSSGNLFMAHKCGFTFSLLHRSFIDAGFADTIGGNRPENFDIWMVAFKKRIDTNRMMDMAALFLP